MKVAFLIAQCYNNLTLFLIFHILSTINLFHWLDLCNTLVAFWSINFLLLPYNEEYSLLKLINIYTKKDTQNQKSYLIIGNSKFRPGSRVPIVLFHGFPQPIEANIRKRPHAQFLSSKSEFIIHTSPPLLNSPSLYVGLMTRGSYDNPRVRIFYCFQL